MQLGNQLDSIKQINENGVEFWYARDLMPMLDYRRWENFNNAIERAKKSCRASNIKVFEHFRNVTKTLPMPHGAEKQIDDYMLTRHACYLVAQNGDPKKPAVALAQAYFSVKTREQELLEESEYKRLEARSKLKECEKNFFLCT